MKKTLIAAGIAAVIAAPVAFADVTVYGKVRMAVQGGDTTDTFKDYANRVGFKGSEDLGNGMTAMYGIELNTGNDARSSSETTFNNDNIVASRAAYVGLKGGFGTVMLGDLSSPQKLSYKIATKLEDTMGDRSDILNQEGGWKNDAIAYVSPTVNGFHVAAATVTASDEYSAATSIAAMYANGPLYIGVANTSQDAVGSADVNSITARYSMGDLMVAATYEDAESANSAVKETNWLAEVNYAMGGGNTLIVSYGETDDKDATPTSDVEDFVIAVEHAFSKRTSVMAIYEDKTSGTTDTQDWAIQVNHNF